MGQAIRTSINRVIYYSKDIKEEIIIHLLSARELISALLLISFLYASSLYKEGDICASYRIFSRDYDEQ